MSLPELPSSLCFLDPKDMRELTTLVESFEDARATFRDELQAGFRAADQVKQKIVWPVRNPLESGRKYDEDVNETVKQSLSQSDEFLRTKWNACLSGADYLLDLQAKQDEVRAFLDKADAKAYARRPRPDSKHVQREFEVSMPEATRDALDELYDRMIGFTEIPLRSIYDGQVTKLYEMSTEMKKMAGEHSHYWKHAADVLGEGDKRDIQRFDAFENTTSNALDRIKTSLEVCGDSIPDLYEMQIEYRHSMRSDRGKS